MGRKKTHAEFIQEVYEVHKEDYTILSRYKGSKKNVWVRHNTCGKVYESRADTVASGGRCLDCIYQSYMKTHEEYVKEVYDKHKGEYIVVGKYRGAHNYIDILHKECGSILTVNANGFLQGKECYLCYNKKRTKTQTTFEKEVYELVGDEYSVEGSYINAVTPVRLIHKTCGEPYEVTPNSFISGGSRCSNCSFSKGEGNIQEYLDKIGVLYEREKSFSNLVNVKPLRFDFYLPEYNTCIEFDGIQHFEVVEYFGGEDYLKRQQHNDGLKNTYCKMNNIHLLRIPYTELGNEPELINNYIQSIHKINELELVGF